MKGTVMITAAASGIGLAVAQLFSASGHEVFVSDLDKQAVDSLAGSDLTARCVDVTDVAAVDNWFDETLRATDGRLDVLINNAGIAGPTARLEEIRPEDWRACLAVGLDGQFLCSRRAIPAMKARRSGCIINLSSTSGLYGVGLRTPYAAAKWAVVGLSKSMAIELGPWNIRVNAVCPGCVSGERMARVIEAESAARGLPPEIVEKEYIAGQSLHRFVEPSEVAELCVFLATPAAKMISGQAIAIDGNSETFHIG